MSGRVVIYRDRAGEFRWSDIVPSIGNEDETVADSADGYVDRSYCEQRALLQARGRPVWFRTTDGDEELVDLGRPLPTAAEAADVAVRLEAFADSAYGSIDVAVVRLAAGMLRQFAGVA